MSDADIDADSDNADSADTDETGDEETMSVSESATDKASAPGKHCWQQLMSSLWVNYLYCAKVLIWIWEHNPFSLIVIFNTL